jgi:hypothetical protein
MSSYRDDFPPTPEVDCLEKGAPVSDLKSSGFGIEFTAPQSVNDVIASLGRTEDVCFSPSNRRLAVAAFIRHRVALFDIESRRLRPDRTLR